MKKYDRFFEIGKKYVNRTSKYSTEEESYPKDGYVILLSRTPKTVSHVDKYGHEHTNTIYPIECNGKNGWAELRIDTIRNKELKEMVGGYDTYEHLHRVTSSGMNWAPYSVGAGAEIY